MFWAANFWVTLLSPSESTKVLIVPDTGFHVLDSSVCQQLGPDLAVAQENTLFLSIAAAPHACFCPSSTEAFCQNKQDEKAFQDHIIFTGRTGNREQVSGVSAPPRLISTSPLAERLGDAAEQERDPTSGTTKHCPL